MLTDARAVPNGTVIHGDVCIVGAGAAGITLARSLAGTGRRIVVLESGGLDFDEVTQGLYEGRIIGHSFTPLALDRLRYLGGTTNHWSGECEPFHADDFDGWPFGRDSLDLYYREAQEICQLGPFTYDPSDWQTDRAGPLKFAPGARIRTGVVQDSPPTRFGQVYREDLTKAEGVTVFLNANAVDLATDENARRVTGLDAACLKGDRFRVDAACYVLAAGAIENARLLLNADKVQPRGLGNGFDLVGRYFMDHAAIANAATILFQSEPAGLAFYLDGSDKLPGAKAQGYLHIAPEVRSREGLAPCLIALLPGAPINKGFAKPALLSLYGSIRSGHIPDHLAFEVGQIMRGVAAKVENGYLGLLHAKPSFYSTQYVSGAAPDRDSRVTLIESVDALGLRQVALDWRLPRDFERDLRRTHEILGEELGRAGFGRLRINLDDPGRDAVAEAQNAHHHMGTTRMHADPRQGVVDANCRVHGMANLFIAGSSVFPTYSADHPTMTIVALAVRLADHLKTLLT
jgi:choline dehydrogenase-like flavoprotein